MSLHWPKIRLTEGDTVIFDGYGVVLEERVSSDTFLAVDGSGGEHERHIDWFADEAAKAECVVISRE